MLYCFTCFHSFSGQALLNASKDQKGDSSKNDILHKASLLGVKTQTVKEFLHVSTKYMSHIKSQKKALQKEKEILQGMSPITWDQDKENTFILKVEDNEQIYRPLFKQFDTAPKLACNDYGSPFDVGIVLAKQNDLNHSKRKSSRAPAKGGYCESCDHWYKGTLKEHLNSSKHHAFIASGANFSSLEAIASGLPNLNCFMRKFEPNDNQEVLSSKENNYMEIRSVDDLPKTCEVESDGNINNTRKVISNESSNLELHMKSNTCDSRCTLKELDTCSIKPLDNSQNQSLSYLTCGEKEKPVHSLTRVNKVTVNGVQKNIFSHNSVETERAENDSAMDSNASETNISTFAISGYSNTFNMEKTKDETNSYHYPTMTTYHSTPKMYTKEKPGLTEAHFSSSSWSLGDNGVDNVLTFLQSHCSGVVGRCNVVSGRNSVETVRTEKSFISKESSVVKGSTTSTKSVISKSVLDAPPDLKRFVKLSCDKGNSLLCPSDNNNLCDGQRYEGNQADCEKKTLTDVSNSKQNLASKTDIVATLPEYSYITDESVSSEIPKADNYELTHNDKEYEVKCKTPLKEECDGFRNEMMKNVASSGSTWSSIRNWLLPEGQNINHGSDPDKHLDKTLVEDCCPNDFSGNTTLKKNEEHDIRNIFNDDSTASSNNFVATWIKNQKFEDSANPETIQHDPCAEDIQVNNHFIVTEESATVQKRGTANEYDDMFIEIKDLNNDTIDKNNDVKTESVEGNTVDLSDCTSISDCTLENFRFDVDKPLDRNDLIHENSNKNLECMSENSSLSCHLTDNGIKIKGLLTLKRPSEKSTVSLENNKHAAERNVPNVNVSVPCSEQHVGSSASNLGMHFENTHKNLTSVTNQEGFTINTEAQQSSVEDIPPQLEKEPEIRKFLEYGENGKNGQNISVRNQEASDAKQKVDVFPFNLQFPFSHISSPQYNNNMYSPISQPSQFGVESNHSQMQNYSTKEKSSLPNPLADGVHSNIAYSYNSGIQQSRNDQQMIRRNEGFIHGDYFNTGILPYETQAVPHGYDSNLLQADFSQSYSNSSCYMNTMTDYLNISSPQQHSGEQGNTSHPFPSYNSNMFTSSLLNSQCCDSTISSIRTEHFCSQKSKPAAVKRKTKKVTKCKTNDSQLPLLSSVSTVHAYNPAHSSSFGISSNIVEPAQSLQSDWYPSSPQSASFSTIRLEDIAEVNSEYNYSFNKPTVKCAGNERVNPQKTNATNVMSYQSNLIPQHDAVNDISVQRSPSNCLNYSSQYSYEKNIAQITNNQNNTASAHIGQVDTFFRPRNQFHHQNFNSYSSQGLERCQLNSSQNYTGAFVNNKESHYQSMRTDFGTQSEHSKAVAQAEECHFANNAIKTNMLEIGLNRQANMNSAVQRGIRAGVYNAVQTGETRLRISKISFSQPQQMQNDLKSYWNVRKAGDCRLVFSNQLGKRKAEDFQSNKTGDYSEFDRKDSFNYHHPNKRRCLIY